MNAKKQCESCYYKGTLLPSECATHSVSLFFTIFFTMLQLLSICKPALPVLPGAVTNIVLSQICIYISKQGLPVAVLCERREQWGNFSEISCSGEPSLPLPLLGIVERVGDGDGERGGDDVEYERLHQPKLC